MSNLNTYADTPRKVGLENKRKLREREPVKPDNHPPGFSSKKKTPTQTHQNRRQVQNNKNWTKRDLKYSLFERPGGKVW